MTQKGLIKRDTIRSNKIKENVLYHMQGNRANYPFRGIVGGI